jgi:hypothetical protein
MSCLNGPGGPILSGKAECYGCADDEFPLPSPDGVKVTGGAREKDFGISWARTVDDDTPFARPFYFD